MKAIIYARQSSGDNDNSESVELQIEKCKRYANEHGYTVLDVHFDNNTSGKTYPNTAEAIAFSKGDTIYQKWLIESANKSVRKIYRDGLGNVIKQLNNVDAVIVYDSTRLMRPLQNSFLSLFIKQRFIANNVVLDTVSRGIINYNIFTDNLVENTVSDINNEQIEIQKKKSIEALKKLKDDGRLASGSVAYGFKSDYHGGVTVDETEMQHIRYIFKAVADGIKYIDITRYLHHNANKKWSFSEIKKCVNRVCYSGHAYDTKGNLIKSKVFPEIIPFSLQLTAMNRVNVHRQTRKDKKNIHPLSGFVRCSICGAKMQLARIDPLKGYFSSEYGWTYKCEYGYIYSGKRCDGVGVRESYTTEKLNGLLESLLPFVYKFLAEYLKPKTDATEKIAVINNESANIDKLESLLMNQVLKGNISQDDFDKKFTEFAEKRKELNRQKIVLQADNSGAIENAAELARAIVESSQLGLQEYKNVAPYVFEKIVSYKNHVEVWTVGAVTPIIIERIVYKNVRSLPLYTVFKHEDGKTEFIYQYKSFLLCGDTERKTIYEDENIKISTIGTNDKAVVQQMLYKKRYARRKAKRSE